MKKVRLFVLVLAVIGIAAFFVYQYMPWLSMDVDEMSMRQREVTRRYLIADGLKLSTDRQKYGPGDTVLLTIENNSRVELKRPNNDVYQQKALTYGIELLRAKKEPTGFILKPGATKTVSLVIPKTADPGRYKINTDYRHIDWAPGGDDLAFYAPAKYIQIVGPPPPPIPEAGRTVKHSPNHVTVYLGKKTTFEAIVDTKPLELEFILPEGVGLAKLKGYSPDTYEKHGELLPLQMVNGKSASGGNTPPDYPASFHIETMELDREAATSYGYRLEYRDWVHTKQPLRFRITIEMEVIY